MKSNKNIFKPNETLQIRLNIFIGILKEGSSSDEINTYSSGANEGKTTDELSSKEVDEGNSSDQSISKEAGEGITIDKSR